MVKLKDLPARSEPKAKTTTAAAGWFARTDVRESVETIVFVAILVSLLKTFCAEAFVIPTGSMATTLLGAHKNVKCPQCGYVSPINASDEVEGGIPLTRGVCQNCRERLVIRPGGIYSGDHVLVAKFLYEGLVDPKRWDVVVFKCPDYLKSRTNFIKRLIGVPGDRIRILYGDILVNSDLATDFTIARKPPDVMMAVRRLVFDNNLQPKDLQDDPSYPGRWRTQSPNVWSIVGDAGTFATQPSGFGWLDYHHVVGGHDRDGNLDDQVITDFEAYNSGIRSSQLHFNWVGDLMVEFNVNVHSLDGSMTIEMAQGKREYDCIVDFAKKEVSLRQNDVELVRRPSPITGTGKWNIRFADFDSRLTLWVSNQLVFGDGHDVTLPTLDERGPVAADLRPVRLGAQDAKLTISNLAVYRDIYYTQTARDSDFALHTGYPLPSADWLPEWQQRLKLVMYHPVEFECGPDQFLMFGDNSPCSSDSREWELTKYVSRHQVLGKALLIYLPRFVSSSRGFWNWRFVR